MVLENQDNIFPHSLPVEARIGTDCDDDCGEGRYCCMIVLGRMRRDESAENMDNANNAGDGNVFFWRYC